MPFFSFLTHFFLCCVLPRPCLHLAREAAPKNNTLAPPTADATETLRFFATVWCHFVAIESQANLVPLDDVGKLSGPDEAVVRRDEQETIAAVQGGRSGLHQPGLDVPSAWFYT